MEYNYNDMRFVFDTLSKNIYMDGYKIWQDTENHIGNPDYYDTFEDWVEENYYDHIIEWLGIAGYDKLNTLPDDLRNFVISTDIYDVDANGIITVDGRYVNADDIREQMEHLE